MKAIKRVIAMLVVFGAAVLSGATARADSTSCTVGLVAWTDQDSGTVQINCGGSWYYAFGSSGTGCPTTSTDGKKAYMSMAQAALLSGKTLNLNYTVCTNGPGITYVSIQN